MIENENLLRDICIKQAKKLGLEGKKEYQERLEYEIGLLKEKNFIDYILIVTDIVHVAREKGVFVGPSRGSVGGSLVCYLTQITQIDPLKYGLLFERFVSPSRRDLPDIDLDFASSRRDEMIQYVSEKYGEDCICRIPTNSTFGTKQTLKDVTRVFDIPYKEVEKLTSQIEKGDTLETFFDRNPDAKKFQNKNPKIVEVAKKIEGSIRHRGLHAAGVVVSPKPFRTAGYEMSLEKVKGKFASCFDKTEVEPLGFLKMDFLGVEAYDVIQEAIDLRRLGNLSFELPTEFDDKKVYKIFQEGRTEGIFQFNTPLLTNLSKQLQVDNFDLLTDANALVRPGPLRSGETKKYVARQLGKQKITYLDEGMKEITEGTNGLLVYQEQLMAIVHKIGKLSLDKADKIRKLVSKSKGADALDEYKNEFIEGCEDKETGEKIWNILRESGAYLFNKSHSCAYAVVAYWDAFLKTYYPREFLAATIEFEKDDNAKRQAILGLKNLGYEVLPPDVRKSRREISIDNNIILGLKDVDGLGEKAIAEIISKRPYTSFDDFLSKVEKRKVNSRILKNLISAGAFDSFGSRSELYYSLVTDEEAHEWDEKEQILRQSQVLDLPSDRPLIDYYENPLGDYLHISELKDIDFNESLDEVWVRGIVSNFKTRKTAPKVKNLMKAEEMAFFDVNDGTKTVPSFIPPEVYSFYKGMLEDGDPVLLKCHTFTREKLYVDGVINLNHYNEEDPLVGYALYGEDNRNIIKSVTYHVSKKGNSFARINFGNGDMGLLFQLPDEYLRVGDELEWEYTKKDTPFIKIKRR